MNISNTTEEPQRRKLIKSVITSLLTALVFSSRSDAQEPRKRSGSSKSGRQRVPKVTNPKKVPCEPSGSTEPHEPPIGFEGGSLLIEVPKSNDMTVGSPVPDDPRPFKQTLGTANYTGIEELRVLTRPRGGRPFFNRYLLPLDSKYQLRIWLVSLKDNSGPDQDDYESPGTECQLILKLSPPMIESEEKLKKVGNSHKHSVPIRYEYPGRLKHFHVGKWQITDDRGTVVKDNGNRFEGFGYDSYHLYVSFYHT